MGTTLVTFNSNGVLSSCAVCTHFGTGVSLDLYIYQHRRQAETTDLISKFTRLWLQMGNKLFFHQGDLREAA